MADCNILRTFPFSRWCDEVHAHHWCVCVCVSKCVGVVRLVVLSLYGYTLPTEFSCAVWVAKYPIAAANAADDANAAVEKTLTESTFGCLAVVCMLAQR